MGKPHTQPAWVKALLDRSLSPTEFRVWLYLHWRQGRNRSAWPSQKMMADDLGLSPEGIRKITGRLEGKNWIRIHRPSSGGRGRCIHYSVTPPKPQPAVDPSDKETPASEAEKPPTAVGPFQSKPQTAVGPLAGETPNGATEKPPTAVSTNTYKRTQPGVAPAPAHTRDPGGKRKTTPKAEPFVPPTAEQVGDFAEQRGNPIFNAEKFVQHYTGRGWIKKNGKAVLDWRATVQDWLDRDNQRRIEQGLPPLDGYSQFGTHPATEEEIKALAEADVL